jgi:hypothetical protein
MEETPFQNMPVQRLPMDLSCSGVVTHTRISFKQISQEEAGIIIAKTRLINEYLVIDYKE